MKHLLILLVVALSLTSCQSCSRSGKRAQNKSSIVPMGLRTDSIQPPTRLSLRQMIAYKESGKARYCGIVGDVDVCVVKDSRFADSLVYVWGTESNYEFVDYKSSQP